MQASEQSLSTSLFQTSKIIPELRCLQQRERQSIGSVAGYQLEVCRLSAVTEEWGYLQESGLSTPFQQRDWLFSWLISHPRHCQFQPFALIARNDQKLAFMLPLMLERSLFSRRLLWLGHKANDYNAPLFSSRSTLSISVLDAKAILQTLARFLSADCVYVVKQPVYLNGVKNPFAALESRPFTSQTYAFGLERGWPNLYIDSRSSRTRQRERNKLNRLRAGSTVQLRCIRTATEIESLLSLAIKWKSEQLDMAGLRNPFGDDHLQKQLSLLSVSSNKSNCRLYVMEREGAPLAVALILIQSGVFNYYFSAYNPKVEGNTSPGRIMMLKLIQLAARAKLSSFDFSLGDEPYKLEFCEEGLPMTDSGFAITLKGRLRLQLSWLRLGLKRFIKRSDSRLNVVRGLNLLLRRCRKIYVK